MIEPGLGKKRRDSTIFYRLPSQGDHHRVCHHQNEMLARNLLFVRLKRSFVDWINEPYPDSSCISVEFANDSLMLALQPLREKP